MKQVFSRKGKSAESERQNGPRHIGEHINEYFPKSVFPLAENFRKFLASKESNAEKGEFENE